MATSYTKTNWQDAPSTATPITAAQLNRMEKGIEDCSSQGNANELAIAANAEAIQTLESGIQLGSISITQLLLMAHPIGSIYSSTASTSPADLFGGTWEQLYNEAAYVIEEGTSDIWNYRKWSDGTAECWNDTNIDFTVTFVDSSATPFGNLSGGTTQLTTTLPFIFVTAMSWWTGDGRAVIPNRNYAITDSNICKILFAQSNNDASATTVQGAIRVIGKWSTEVDNTPKYVWKRTA